jgi:hypothetical protein
MVFFIFILEMYSEKCREADRVGCHKAVSRLVSSAGTVSNDSESTLQVSSSKYLVTFYILLPDCLVNEFT